MWGGERGGVGRNFSPPEPLKVFPVVLRIPRSGYIWCLLGACPLEACGFSFVPLPVLISGATCPSGADSQGVPQGCCYPPASASRHWPRTYRVRLGPWLLATRLWPLAPNSSPFFQLCLLFHGSSLIPDLSDSMGCARTHSSDADMSLSGQTYGKNSLFVRRDFPC